ncbi:MAG: 1-deoxy-D-xylulose-5-phosphate reductoisomerase [Treponema sp.]|nr:1-deoxy-D-xylulose-5-phosphate reductoisomerase [Treponema sp.]
MLKKKRLAVLGATGSIGKSSIDIISRNNEMFDVVLLSAHSDRSGLEELSRQFPSAVTALTSGSDNLCEIINDIKPDITINGISGAAGLKPSIAAINAGSRLALANKETIVMAGEYIIGLAKEKNVNIIPVDSEHSAVFNLIKNYTGSISEMILTASGGPFKNLSLHEMEKVTVEDALSHPTWKMGHKITIDSASMANKGLEIIEACHFFNMPSSKIKVVIHPQSIIHSMIRLCNGVIYAQASKPDMRHPIHDALFWPMVTPSSLEQLNFDNLTLDFKKPDTQKFPMLKMAWEAAEKGSLYPCAYNAANEMAAAAFLEQKIKFLDIPKITEHVLQSDWMGIHLDIDAVLKADADARQIAAKVINSLKLNS